MAPKREQDLIAGNVAAILDKREVALNVGSDAGVELGMRFVILDQEGVTIKDPASGKPIGEVQLPKHVVKVVRVSPKMSVARTFRVIKGRPGIAASSFGPTPDRVETLSVAEGTTLKEALLQEGGISVVEVGDAVVETVGDEYDA